MVSADGGEGGEERPGSGEKDQDQNREEHEDDTLRSEQTGIRQNAFEEEKQLTLETVHANGTTDTIMLSHTYNKAQIDWFKAGSALNLIRKQNA